MIRGMMLPWSSLAGHRVDSGGIGAQALQAYHTRDQPAHALFVEIYRFGGIGLAIAAKGVSGSKGQPCSG